MAVAAMRPYRQMGGLAFIGSLLDSRVIQKLDSPPGSGAAP
jgi:hypothetical protein